MPKSKWAQAFLVAAIILCGDLFLDRKSIFSDSPVVPGYDNQAQMKAGRERSTTDPAISTTEPAEPHPAIAAPEVNNQIAKPVIGLTSANFQGEVIRCFQGEKCRLQEDPWALYQEFKTSGNRKLADQLISYLRSQLKDPEFKAVYKDSLKKMIDDFYPREEIQFQQAAYYNYLGDLPKSLELYQDLEKKAALDPSLRPAPKLNIANTLYDMKKWSEALPYYEAALAEYQSGKYAGSIPAENETIGFINQRIAQIQASLPQR